MEKAPLKKRGMMDIVRKRPATSPVMRKEEATFAQASSVPKEDRVKFSVEKKQEVSAEVGQVAAPVYRVAEPTYRLEEKEQMGSSEKVEAVAEPHRLEMHDPEGNPLDQIIPETSSIEMERPIAYIPKEKPSREEKKMFERIERRERYYDKGEGKGRNKKGIVTWIISCLLLGVGAYLVVAVLPRAEIVLTPKTVVWPPSDSYANVIGANTKIAEIDPVNKQIPVAVFSEKKTNAFQFPATGSGKSIERMATGKVTIYNDFNGVQQPLLAGTRLETPDGKIFKLKDRVVVPGATTVGGKLVAASVEADVVADKAGETYNISPVSKFTIPGFKGTVKYDGFYGESKDPMTGGFIGEGKYPTADDIAAGKASAEKQMQEVIDSFMATQVVPEGFKIIDSSKKYSITKENVNEAVDDQGNFSVYIEAESSVDALKEEHVLKLMTALAQQVNGEGYEIKSHTLSYGEVSVDAKSGLIALPVEFKGVFWKPIDIDAFKRNIIGKKEDELKTYIVSSTNVDHADIALWPFWVRTVSNDVQRVKVEVQ